MTTTPSPIDGTISLEDYSNFQYMLARPSVAKVTVNQIISFVFYRGPFDKQKTELDHHVVCRGRVTLINYYFCCLAVLPSHILGMSRWISAVNESKNGSRIPSGETLRRFRYSYYCGWLQVETYHISVGGDANIGNDQKFLLVEYMVCPVSPWLFFYAVLALMAFVIVSGLQSWNIVCVGAPFTLLVGSVMVFFHLIIYNSFRL